MLRCATAHAHSTDSALLCARPPRAGRLTNKQRKRTLTEEVLADAELQQVRKKRYAKLQEERQELTRKRGRKTDKPRLKKAHHRPKH